MTYTITERETRNRTTRIVTVKQQNIDMEGLVTDMEHVLVDKWPVVGFQATIKDRNRPKIESSNKGTMYFRMRDTGEIEVRLSMLDDDVREYAVKKLEEKDGAKGGLTGRDYVDEDFQSDDTEKLEDRTIGTSNVEPQRVNDTVDEVVRPQGKQGTTLIPPFDKDEVGYVEGNNTHGSWKACEDCVHYVSGGGCKMVKGDIEPDAHCDDLYADLQINGRTEEDGFKTNLIAKGDNFKQRMMKTSVQNIIKSVTDAIKSRLG